jgi:hypothetical protein
VIVNYSLSRILSALLLFIISSTCSSSSIIANPVPKKPISYRGISSNQESLWIAGSLGTVLKLNNSNITNIQIDSTITNWYVPTNREHTIVAYSLPWDTVSPQGFERYDFRDIESLDNQTAIVMSVGDSARILKTTDGGNNWKIVYRNFSPNVFLDAIAIDWKSGFGFAIGDPQLEHELLLGDATSTNNRPEKNTQGLNVPGWKFQTNTQKKHPVQRSELHNNHSNEHLIKQSNSLQLKDTSSYQKKYFLMLITVDSGNSWHRIPACSANVPQDSIAAFFAGSGSSLHILKSTIKRNKLNAITHLDVLVGMAGGGQNPSFRILKINHHFQNSKALILEVNHQTYPLALGNGAGWGAYGGLYSAGKLYWVGGNYLFPNHGDSTVNFISNTQIQPVLKGKNLPHSLPFSVAKSSGYKSGICECAVNNKSILFAAGSSGLDLSFDHGNQWKPLYAPAYRPQVVPVKQDAISPSNIPSNAPNPDQRNSNPLDTTPKISGSQKISVNGVGCFKNGILLIGNRGLATYLPLHP